MLTLYPGAVQTAHRAFHNVDILSAICLYLPFMSLFHLRQVDRTSRRNINYFLRYQWSLRLRHFVRRPFAFRQQVFTACAMFSGGSVLSYFLQASARIPPFESKDLDVYCPFQTAALLVDYLLKEEGYTILSSHPHPDNEYGAGIANIVKLVHPITQAFIDIICSARPSPFTPIVEFWGMHVMNVIGPNIICIPYPRLTLNGIGFIANPAGLHSPRIQACVQKYQDRGFMITPPDNSPFLHNASNAGGRFYCAHHPRSFGDAGCLTITFDDMTDDIYPPGIQSPHFGASWILGGMRCMYCDDHKPRRFAMSKDRFLTY